MCAQRDVGEDIHYSWNVEIAAGLHIPPWAAHLLYPELCYTAPDWESSDQKGQPSLFTQLPEEQIRISHLGSQRMSAEVTEVALLFLPPSSKQTWQVGDVISRDGSNDSACKLYWETILEGGIQMYIYWESMIVFCCIVWDKPDVFRHDEYACRARVEEIGLLAEFHRIVNWDLHQYVWRPGAEEHFICFLHFCIHRM